VIEFSRGGEQDFSGGKSTFENTSHLLPKNKSRSPLRKNSSEVTVLFPK